MALSYSVVVPCYNVEGYVGAAVRSALAQTPPPAEVVCVDDGSADGTLAVLGALGAADARVRILAQAHAGAPSARNAGLRAARGAWVQFLDADDRLLPGKVARQLRLGEGYDLVAGSAWEERPAEAPRVREVGGEPWRDLLMDGLGITSANLFRRAAVEACGGWDEALPCWQEYELMFRMLARGAQVAYDATPGTEIGYRPGSVGKSEHAFSVGMAQRARVLAHARRQGLFSGPEEQALLDFFFRWIRSHYGGRPAEALAAHRALIPASFVPTPGGNTTRRYVMAYRILGFARAERLRRGGHAPPASPGRAPEDKAAEGRTRPGALVLNVGGASNSIAEATSLASPSWLAPLPRVCAVTPRREGAGPTPRRLDPRPSGGGQDEGGGRTSP